MPQAKKARTTTKKASPSSDHGLQVLYDKLTVIERSTTSEKGPLTEADAVRLLKWETEKQYQKRMVSENPDSKPEEWSFGEVYHCLDEEGEKVRCWANAGNRPFDMKWCKDIIDMILRGQWAGPLTVPGETINGETIRISKYGRVLSGQHQLTALKLACERLRLDRGKATYNPLYPKYPFWTGSVTGPVIETLLIMGLSEDERVLRTIDYNKPRNAADMLYTMNVFRNNAPRERQELTRMLSAAIDLLWVRTATKGYKTHPEIIGFLERHKRLLQCVEHLFIENNARGDTEWQCNNCGRMASSSHRNKTKCDKVQSGVHDDTQRDGRRISKLRLSAGQCAALCYLMGSSGLNTDGDIYRNEFPPSEKNLDWSRWNESRDFWSRLADDRAFRAVRKALGRLVTSSPTDEDNMGLGGRQEEKLAVLSKAWAVYSQWSGPLDDMFDEKIDLAPNGALYLSYSTMTIGTSEKPAEALPEGQRRLSDVADFGGIDCPDTAEADAPPPPTRDEIEAAKRDAAARHAKADEKPVSGKRSLDDLADQAARNSQATQAKK